MRSMVGVSRSGPLHGRQPQCWPHDGRQARLGEPLPSPPGTGRQVGWEWARLIRVLLAVPGVLLGLSTVGLANTDPASIVQPEAVVRAVIGPMVICVSGCRVLSTFYGRCGQCSSLSLSRHCLLYAY